MTRSTPITFLASATVIPLVAVAAAASNRQTDRRHRPDRLKARNDHPLGRQAAGDL